MKTDADIRREEKALEINGELTTYPIEVMAGGRRGPYSVMIRRLNKREMREVVKVLTGYVDAERAKSRKGGG